MKTFQRTSSRWILAFMTATVIVSSSLAAQTASEKKHCFSDDDYIYITTAKRIEKDGDDMGSKLLRGLTNLLTGWCEIPRQMIRTYQSDGPFLCVPLGFLRGIVMTGYRTGFGAFDTAFFLAPVNGTYSGMMKPDYVWQSYAGHRKDNSRQAKNHSAGGDYGKRETQISK